MKPRSPATSRRFLLAFAVLLAWHPVTPAAETVTPPRAHLQSVAEIAAATRSARSMGITLSRATHVLRRQLGLRRGAGLVADDVAAGSPAARAGFVQHDVLVRLDDQWLLLPEQFDALLEAAEPDDPLDCTVLRAGREVVIGLGPPGGRLQPTATARSLRPTASSLALIPPATAAHAGTDRLPQPPAGLADETLVRQDDDFSILLSRGDRTRLVVNDPHGGIVFTGEIDTAAGRAAVPEAVRARVADMERLLEPRPTTAAGSSPREAPRTAGPTAEIGRLEIAPIDLR